MSNVEACVKCSLNINLSEDEYTVCDGKCGKSFHIKCVGLDVTALDVLSSNVFWMCDECVEDFNRYRGRSTTDAATNTYPHATIEDEIKQLRSTVADIADTLAKLTQKAPIIPHNSTPISPETILDGTDESYDNATEDEVEITQRTHASQRTEDCSSFALYLSHIDRSATETDISRLVSRSLAAPLSNCSDVVKLVPKGKNINTLDYISFKIVLDIKLRQIALAPTTWPKGVMFREFVNRLNATWKPN